MDVPGGGWVPDTWIPGPAPTTLPTTHPGGPTGYSKAVVRYIAAEYVNGYIVKNAYSYSTWVSVAPIYADIWVPSTPTVIGHWAFTVAPNYGANGATGWTPSYN